jgi:hypothetical protein
MTERVPARRRSQQPRTRFDNSNRNLVLRIIAGVLAASILIGAVLMLAVQNPEFGLSLQMGGISRGGDIQPRNFRLWAIQPDGKLRFATAFFPSQTNAPASEAFTVAGPLVDSQDDILETHYFGALNITSNYQPGSGNDSTRTFKMFFVEHDPTMSAYGVDMMVQNPPYVIVETSLAAVGEAPTSYIAMGAQTQKYYSQVIVAVAFPPGAVVKNIHYVLPSAPAGQTAESVMLPYRRVLVNEWLVYYFDQTSLPQQQTVRIQFLPPADTTKPAPELSLWEVDRQR